MQSTLLGGAALAVGGALVVVIGSALGLDTESVALLGVAIGGVVALVPDRTPLARLGGFAAGFVIAWVGFAVRAALLPDTSGGRAVFVFVVLALCTVVAVAARERLPLWTLLLGVVALTGAYEFTFAAAPPEFLTTSVTTATALFLSVAVGFCAVSIASLFQGRDRAQPRAHRAEPDPTPADDTEQLRLNDILEKSK